MGVLLNLAGVTVKFISKLLITLRDSALVVVLKCYLNHVLLFNFPYWEDDPKLPNMCTTVNHGGTQELFDRIEIKESAGDFTQVTFLQSRGREGRGGQCPGCESTERK